MSTPSFIDNLAEKAERAHIIIALRMIAAIAIVMSFWYLSKTFESNMYAHVLYENASISVVDLPRDAIRPATPWLYRRVEVTGWLDTQNTVLLDDVQRLGIDGKRVFTMLYPKNGGSHILVDRGWMAEETVPSLEDDGNTTTTVGLLLTPNIIKRNINRYQTEYLKNLDIDTIAKDMNISNYWSLVLMVSPDSAATATGAVSDEPTVLSLSNDYLAYTLVWFAILVAIIAGLTLEHRMHRSDILAVKTSEQQKRAALDKETGETL